MVSTSARVVILIVLLFATTSCGQDMWANSYKRFGCRGQYDKYKMVHLERVCDECYHLVKEQDIHIACRKNCFGTTTFINCMEAVALNELRKEAVMQAWVSLRAEN